MGGYRLYGGVAAQGVRRDRHVRRGAGARPGRRAQLPAEGTRRKNPAVPGDQVSIYGAQQPESPVEAVFPVWVLEGAGDAEAPEADADEAVRAASICDQPAALGDAGGGVPGGEAAAWGDHCDVRAVQLDGVGVYGIEGGMEARVAAASGVCDIASQLRDGIRGGDGEVCGSMGRPEGEGAGVPRKRRLNVRTFERLNV